jgi:hypothetical protein
MPITETAVKGLMIRKIPLDEEYNLSLYSRGENDDEYSFSFPP